MKELINKLTTLGYVVSNVRSKSLFGGFSFEVNGTTISVTDRELKDVDGVVDYIRNNIDKEEKMKTVTENVEGIGSGLR